MENKKITVNSNKNGAATIENILNQSNIVDGVWHISETHFEGFGDMLYALTNPFEALNKEGREKIKEIAFAKGVTQCKIVD
jgi:hypothetical protein